MTSVVAKQESLTAQDRCDKCQAQAMVKAVFTSGELLFCGHHAKKAGHALTLKSIRVYDPEGYLSGNW